MNTKLAAVLLGTVLLTGCGPVLSLHPLYTDNDRAFDPALLGTWTDEEEKDVYRVKQSGQTGYDVLYVKNDQSEKQNFDVRLVSLGAYKFLDMSPQHVPDFTIPAHLVVKIRLEKDKLQVGAMDYDWIKAEISKEPPPVAWQSLGKDQVILTATTAGLREFVLRYAAEPKAWSEGELHRIK